MAHFDDSAINTVELTMVVNKIVGAKLLQIAKERDILLDAVLGQPQEGNGPFDAAFERLDTITGRKIEVDVMDGGATWTGVARGSGGEGADASLEDVAEMGGMEFDVAELVSHVKLYDSQLDRYQGKEAKHKFYDSVATWVMDGLYDQLSTALHATGAGVGPAASVFGSWVHAVSDGTTATGTQSDYATYGTIDRTDAANGNFGSYVKDASGALTLSMLGECSTRIMGKLGHPKVGVTGETLFNKIRTLLEGNLDATISGDGTVSFSGDKLRYAGVTYGLSMNCPSGHVGIFDPTVWTIVRKGDGVVVEPPTRLLTKNATSILYGKAWYQNICKAPNRQAKIVAATA